MDKTIEYYEQNARAFADDTINVEFTYVQDKFLKYMPEGAHILDYGCGTGRDTKYFMSKGFMVDAIDGSVELCKIAGKNTGIDVKHMMFDELNDIDKYDGIWACSSILHLHKEELEEVFLKMIVAVKSGGYIYTSFKYGDFSGYRNGRYFTDFTDDSFGLFMEKYPDIEITEQWISGDVRPGRGEEKWLNLILRKN